MLIRCIFGYFQKKRKVLMINVINSNINVKKLLSVFIHKKCVSKHSITHVVLITIINCAKLYILINSNYIKFSYILFKKGEFYLSTVMCEISKFQKKTYAILMFDNRLLQNIANSRLEKLNIKFFISNTVKLHN